MQVPFVGKGTHSPSFPVVTLHAGDSWSLHPQDTQPSSFMGSSEPLGWVRGAATGIRAEEIQVEVTGLDVRPGGGAFPATHDVPRETCVPAASLLMCICLSICLCGSEAQAGYDSPPHVPRPSAPGPTCTGWDCPCITPAPIFGIPSCQETLV